MRIAKTNTRLKKDYLKEAEKFRKLHQEYGWTILKIAQYYRQPYSVVWRKIHFALKVLQEQQKEDKENSPS